MTTWILASMAGLSLMILAVGNSNGEPPSDHGVVWNINNLKRIGGHDVRVAGDPRIATVANGKAVEFDGLDDAMFLDVHPLADAKQFTVEVIFRPDADGPPEQRFFHMQERAKP
jgi:hypothetical protein